MLIVALVTSVAVFGFGIGGLSIGVAFVVGSRLLSTPGQITVLTGLAVLLGGSGVAANTLLAGVVVVFTPLLLPSNNEFTRTHRYLLVGGVVIALPILFMSVTAGVVWPATLAVLTLLIAATIAVYWYTAP